MKKLKFYVLIIAAFLLVSTVNGFAKDKIVKKQLMSEGKKRSFYLFVPKSVSKDKPAPLLVLLHGSGRDGKILVEHWQELAEREGIILAGPDALKSSTWSIPNDAPQFIYDLVEDLKSNQPVDSRRIYLFGHSAGAAAGLLLSLLESEYFAATAVSAGAVQSSNYSLFDDAERKIPIALFVGEKDPLFPLKIVRETRDAFKERDFTVELTEIPNLDHNYYSKSAEINKMAWEFLAKYRLESDQKYKKYNFK